MHAKRLMLSCAVGALAAAAAVPARSQEAQAPGSQPGANTVAEVVVTADRREESLQDVPTAVSAYTSETRELVGIITPQDVSNFTPGLQYSSQLDRISLRGIGRQTNVLAADPGVATYNDGIYTSVTIGAGRSPLFVDRVEVLRGPQGTLYGRNSIGGAINVISRRPTDDPYAEVRATLANYDRYVLEGAASGPLAEGLQWRLGGFKEVQEKGWFDNVVEGGQDEGNVVNRYYLEGQLQWQVGERFDGWLKFATGEDNNPGGGAGARNSFSPDPYDRNEIPAAAILLNGGYACSPFATNVVFAPGSSCENPASRDPRKFAADTPTAVDSQFLDYAGDFVLHLEGVDVRYLVGGSKFDYQLVGDIDIASSVSSAIQSFRLAAPPGVPGTQIFPRYYFNYQQNNETLSHEITLSSTWDRKLQYIVGAYAYREGYQQPVFTELPDQPQQISPVYLPGTVPAGVPTTPVAGPLGALGFRNAPANPQRRVFDSRPDFRNESNAVFGQIDYAFNDQFTLTLGARYSEDGKSGTEQLRVVCFACVTTLPLTLAPEIAAVSPIVPLAFDLTGVGSIVSAPVAPAPLPEGVVSRTTFDPATGFASRDYDASWEAFTGTASLEYTPNDDLLFYGKYSRGFKAGGFRTGVDILFSPNPLTDEETVDAYEAGVKSTLLDGRLQANATAFFYTYENLQVPLTVVQTSGGLAANDSILFNVPGSESLGFELETIWQPVDNLQLLFTYAYLDTEITRGAAIDPADPSALDPQAKPLPQTCPAPGFPQVVGGVTLFGPGCVLDVYTSTSTQLRFQQSQDLAGNALPNSPKHKVALNANYTFDLAGGASLTASGTYVWRDEQFGSIFERENRLAPSWDQVDVRLTYRSADDRFSIIAFGRNIFDELGYEAGTAATRYEGFNNGLAPFIPGGTRTASVQGVGRTFFLTPPRTYGVEFQYRFF